MGTVGERHEIYYFSSSGSHVSVLVSDRRQLLYWNWDALDDRLSDSMHRAYALRASALRQVGALATVISGAVTLLTEKEKMMKYDPSTITIAYFLMSLGGVLFAVGLAIQLAQIAMRPHS